MCCSHVSLSSTIIPRYLTHLVLFTSPPPPPPPPSTIIMYGVDSGFSSGQFKRCGVPMIINSVFTAFRLSLLLFNHSQTFAKAETICSLSSCDVRIALSKLVSSAYIVTFNILNTGWKIILINNEMQWFKDGTLRHPTCYPLQS